MSDPQVSVVVPFYNAEATLRQALESIAASSLREFEVLMADDCSTDGGSAIAGEFAQADGRFKYFRNDVNRGVSFSRNRGLAAAAGEFALFVDGDDMVSADWIENLVSDAVATKAEIVIGKTIWLDGERESVYKMAGLGKPGPLNFDTLVLKDNSVVWNKLYSMDLLKRERIRFEESISIGEDLLFNFRAMAYARGIHYGGKGHYYYRADNENSVMRSTPPERHMENLSRLLRILSEFAAAIGKKDHPALRKVAKDILRIHYKAGCRPPGAETMALVRRIDPWLPFKVRFTIFRKSIGRALVGR